MAEIKFPANTTLFFGYWPEHEEAAKEYCRERGYTQEDVRIVKRKETHSYFGDCEELQGETNTWYSLEIVTKRPLVVDCGTYNDGKKEGS